MDHPTQFDHDVAVVGGGPAGCAAAVFTARYGLDTVVFDRGNSSLRRCASLENYLGFPGGVDIDTALGLFHDHVEVAGAAIVSELVESVEQLSREMDEGATTGFRLETQDGDALTARAVVAATKYDCSYLRGLDDPDRLFETRGHGENTYQHVAEGYVGRDGSTPVDGLYVAGPLGGSGDQAIIAAGHGAQVARTLVGDRRRAAGCWGDMVTHYDWLRRETELTDEWRDRERWREYFGDPPGDSDVKTDADPERVRESVIDDRLGTYLTDEEIERRTSRGHRRIARQLDPDAVLDALDDEVIRAYLEERERGAGSEVSQA
ncbi:FAD-dependent oxidoreductase [Haloarchaeobius sp. TZWWS8]|uniref:FAD-dependent oxidoreductase n=1 Tax=Haloarchaeobius sp. TZWWS8 TaxID=3446121 RepID=UPI003EC0D19B